MALTFASYVTSDYAKPLAVAAVVAFTVVNYFGVTKTAGLARILLALTLAALTVVLVGIFGGRHLAVEHLGAVEQWASGGLPGILQAAGLLFFAFAGYARIATMGEEVRDPQRTFPARSRSRWLWRSWCTPWWASVYCWPSAQLSSLPPLRPWQMRPRPARSPDSPR